MDFVDAINNQTWFNHEEILRWADELAELDVLQATEDRLGDGVSELAIKSMSLRKKCLDEFKNKLSDDSALRILIHVPSIKDSPGGASLFSNLAQSLKYMGVKAEILPWDHDDLDALLASVRPNILLSSDHQTYLDKIDWRAIYRYREKEVLKIGLTASIKEYGNTPLVPRLKRHRRNAVDFFYSFRSPEYLNMREQYQPFFDYKYQIHSVEFGANILVYSPVIGVERDIDYVFLASTNPDKRSRYYEYLSNILSGHVGFLDGPGWIKNARWADQASHRYLYARAKVGLNLHIQDSIDWPSELNERTYILGACGVPQLIDHPMLLSKRFRLEGMFVAESPKQYEELFKYILNHPHEADKRAVLAMEDVYARYTTFHRAEGFARELSQYIGS